jgi:hypothetical protein
MWRRASCAKASKTVATSSSEGTTRRDPMRVAAITISLGAKDSGSNSTDRVAALTTRSLRVAIWDGRQRLRATQPAFGATRAGLSRRAFWDTVRCSRTPSRSRIGAGSQCRRQTRPVTRIACPGNVTPWSLMWSAASCVAVCRTAASCSGVAAANAAASGPASEQGRRCRQDHRRAAGNEAVHHRRHPHTGHPRVVLDPGPGQRPEATTGSEDAAGLAERDSWVRGEHQPHAAHDDIEGRIGAVDAGWTQASGRTSEVGREQSESRARDHGLTA